MGLLHGRRPDRGRHLVVHGLQLPGDLPDHLVIVVVMVMVRLMVGQVEELAPVPLLVELGQGR